MVFGLLKKRFDIFIFGIICFIEIVDVGSRYNYTNEDHSEYLLIVSKEYDANDHLSEKASSEKRKVSCNGRVVFN